MTASHLIRARGGAGYGRLLVLIFFPLLACTAGCALFPRKPVEPEYELPSDIVLPSHREFDHRPYELIWYPRDEEFKPLVDFDTALEWRVEAESGARIRFARSQERQLWGSHVGRITYVSPETGRRAFLGPPEPIPIDELFDSVTVWIKGPDGPGGKGSPQHARLSVIIQDALGRRYDLDMAEIDWTGWWLVHRKLTVEEREAIRFPCRFVGFEWTDLQSDEETSLYIDSLAFYSEPRGALSFGTRPKRNLSLQPGQSYGVNTGTNVLSFPVSDQTVIPPVPEGRATKTVKRADDGTVWFMREDEENSMAYRYIPDRGPAGLEVYWNDTRMVRPLSGAQVWGELPPGEPLVQRWVNGVLHLEYNGGLLYRISLEQNSLILDMAARGGWAKGWSPGLPSAEGWVQALEIPYLDVPAMVYVVEGSPNPSRGRTSSGEQGIRTDSDGESMFLSVLIDGYRSNASRFEQGAIGEGDAWVYDVRTGGRRNDLYERLILTIGPSLETVLPTVPNPPSRHASSWMHKLWYAPPYLESYAGEAEWMERAAQWGMTNILYGTTEHVWRDSTESVALRTRAAPHKGGSEALADFMKRAGEKGISTALYLNYVDFSPLNRHWTMEAVQRLPDERWRRARAAHYALKPLRAAEWADTQVRHLKDLFVPDAVFLDGSARVAPWESVDYDARVPGAGTFAQTFYAYGELMHNLSGVLEGPVVAQDRYGWLYAGLCDLLVRDLCGDSLVSRAYMPIFKLKRLQELSLFLGAGAFPDEENRSAALDRYLAAQIAYGNAGRLLWFEERPDLSVRAYYMMQALQARYLMRAPTRLLYWSGERFMSSSDAIREGVLDRSQIYVRYPDDLEIWVNGSETEYWEVRVGRDRWRMPPSGWIAAGPDMLELSADVNGSRIDYVESPGYLYYDGRGNDQPFRGMASRSPVVLRVLDEEEIRIEVLDIAQTGTFGLAPHVMDAAGLPVCVMMDAAGRNIGEAVVTERDGLHWFQGHTNAVRYVVTYEVEK